MVFYILNFSGSVKQCGDGMPGVHIFPSTDSGGICVTDVAIATGDDGITDTLCISSGCVSFLNASFVGLNCVHYKSKDSS